MKYRDLRRDPSLNSEVNYWMKPSSLKALQQIISIYLIGERVVCIRVKPKSQKNCQRVVKGNNKKGKYK